MRLAATCVSCRTDRFGSRAGLQEMSSIGGNFHRMKHPGTWLSLIHVHSRKAGSDE